VNGAPGPKIYVFASGAALVDERPVTAEQLADELAMLKRRKGVVWYAREHGDRDPTPEQLATFETIVAAQLPIALFIDREFQRPVPPD
jgi:hypothetical protein